jgi:hypothetical protein
MSPALLQLLVLLAQQVPSAVAAAQKLIAEKGQPTAQDFEDLAKSFAVDVAAAEAAIKDAEQPGVP